MFEALCDQGNHQPEALHSPSDRVIAGRQLCSVKADIEPYLKPES